jgi:WD40 repeat protein
LNFQGFTDAPMADHYSGGSDQVILNNMLMVSKWNKDGSLIASGTTDKKVIIWTAEGPHTENVVKIFH